MYLIILPSRANIHTPKGKHTGKTEGKTMTNERMNWMNVEEIIEKRIAEESEIYDLDKDDIKEIRLEVYKACGWDYDAGWDEDEDAEEEDRDCEPACRSLTAIYIDLGLNIHDHFCCR